MKKITLFLLMLFSFTAFAQFPESFETTVPPAGWASFRGTNGLGTGFDWSVSTVAVFVQEGVQSAFVRYEAVTGGSAEDWLVSPMHTVTAPNTLLTFYQRQQYTVDYGTTYDIRVSTTSQTDHATFTTVLSQTEADLNLTTMTVKSVDLSAYVGQSIYIAFVMTNNDGDNWAIDNVNMESSVAAPGCATLLTPADGATIPVGLVNFSWEAPTTGDAPTSYDFYYGIAPDAVDTFLGNYTDTSIDVNVNDYSFTFYWKIVPKNLGGSAIGCPVWTFTTQDPPGYCLSAPNGQYPADTYTPVTCDGSTENVIVSDGWAGEYSVVNVITGDTYIFNSGATDFITLSSDSGATATAFGTTPLTWVADVTGEVRFYSHVDDQCGDEDVNRVRSIVCSSAIAAPSCATLLTPADGATIPVGLVNFSWEAPTTGDAPTSYDFYYGIAPDAVNTLLGNYTDTSIDVNVNDYSFTFYWKIVPKNLGGSATGCPVWTFTTQDPPGYCLGAPFGQFPIDTYTPATCDGLTANIIVTNGWAGEYSVVNVNSGETYTFSSGTTDFITLSSDGGVTATAFGTTPLTWVADVTGEIRFYSHVDDQCGEEDLSRVRSIVCGVVTADTPDYVNLQFPSSIDITQGGSGTVYGQIYEAGLTDVEPGYSGQAAGIQAWVGISPVGENTNPSTWTNWVDATHNAASVGNNDEYMAEIGTGLTPGTYYYATRFRLNSGDYVYGGINASNDGNFWDGTTYLSGVLTVNEPVFVGCLNDPNGQYPEATFTPACTGTVETINNLCYAGEYSNVNLTTGVEYTFSSSIATDRITIGNADGSVVLAYGVTPLTWTSNVTEVVRFYLHTDNACGDNTTFRARNVFCGTPPPAPANDDCANAIALTAGVVFADNALTTTSLGATSNVANPLPTCGAFGFDTNGKDVWYSVVVPEAGTITIETQGNAGLLDTVIEAYSGTCGNLVSILCNDDNLADAYSTLNLTGLTAGETILIRAWGYNGSQGSFVISAFDGSLSTPSFDNANFTYYPNPVKDLLNLSYVSNISKVVVVNLLGQQMITANVNATQGQLDLSALASGTYLVKITTEDNLEKTIKVIKQ